jgi:hypothetical protein
MKDNLRRFPRRLGQSQPNLPSNTRWICPLLQLNEARRSGRDLAVSNEGLKDLVVGYRAYCAAMHCCCSANCWQRYAGVAALAALRRLALPRYSRRKCGSRDISLRADAYIECLPIWRGLSGPALLCRTSRSSPIVAESRNAIPSSTNWLRSCPVGSKIRMQRFYPGPIFQKPTQQFRRS